ncbi:MAG: protein-glutamate O-methyltransferase CheR [Gammaproteobacteria bacterium]|nr:protein-glutamate O-methyltransferase CheR [Gammaproteobacteria bacterium]
MSEISEAEFLRFRDFFYRKTGIFFEPNKRYFVDKRLLQRMVRTGHQGFREYFTHLRFEASGEELQQLTSLLTVNETYFFREEYQFECMVGPVLAEVVKNRRDKAPVRIWSMPSSTGEEPYSIALYLLESWPQIGEVDVEIAASDIDLRVLQLAKEGIYSERSVRNLPKAVLDKYFAPVARGHFQVCKDLRETVAFSEANLSNPLQTRKFRGFDVIFCRNLLIYFDDASRRIAAEALYDALKPGGFLFLGHSESMSRISSLFTVRRFPQAIVYQRPGDAGK